MSFAILLPFFLGFAAVLQGGLNRHIATDYGLPGAVLLNNIVLLVAAGTLFLVTRSSVGVPELFQDRGAFKSFSWWYVLPGIFGFCLVTGIPWAIVKIGAMRFFVAVVGAQILASVLWDIYVEKLPVGGMRVAGALLAMAGAVMVSLDRGPQAP